MCDDLDLGGGVSDHRVVRPHIARKDRRALLRSSTELVCVYMYDSLWCFAGKHGTSRVGSAYFGTQGRAGGRDGYFNTSFSWFVLEDYAAMASTGHGGGRWMDRSVGRSSVAVGLVYGQLKVRAYDQRGWTCLLGWGHNGRYSFKNSDGRENDGLAGTRANDGFQVSGVGLGNRAPGMRKDWSSSWVEWLLSS